ncbi:MAG: hypothetical protein ACI81P_001165, partial [Neolewinella sp.]
MVAALLVAGSLRSLLQGRCAPCCRVAALLVAGSLRSLLQ